MKLTAKLNRVITGTQTLVEFEIPPYQSSWLEKYEDKELTLSISDKKESKTSQQNRYAWVLVSMIDKKINGYKSDEITLYQTILQQANISPIYLETIEGALGTIEQSFRVVEVIEQRVSQKGIKTLMLKCYKGISLLNKEEMAELIEVILQYCTEYEIDVDRSRFE